MASATSKALRSYTGSQARGNASRKALSGSVAGIMGLTGLRGFIFYFVTAFIMSLFLLIKAGKDWQKFFRTRSVLFSNGLLGGLFTYILFWTFLYGMVHVY